MNREDDRTERSALLFEDGDVSHMHPQVGEAAPDFLMESPNGQVSLKKLAARVGIVVLVSQDISRLHGT